MFLIEPLLVLLGLVLCGFLLWNYPVSSGLVMAALGEFWELTQTGDASTTASPFHSGIALYPTDLACIVLSAACVVVFLRTRSFPQDICWPAVLLLGLCLLNFARGSLIFGIKPAGNISRNAIVLVLPMVAFSSLGRVIRVNADRIVHYLSITALVLGAVAVARWSGLLPLPEVSEDYRTVVRVLPSDHALIIGQALIGILGLQLSRGFRPLGLILAGFFAALVLALQHRSVWMATTAGLVWLAFRSPRVVRREWLKLSCLVLFLASALALAPLVASNLFEKVVKLVGVNLAEAEQEDSTWAWRVDGYSEAMERVFSGGLTDIAIGPPIGADLSDKASVASTTIHDRYISILVYYGLAGLVFLLIWLALSAVRIHLLDRRAKYPDRGASFSKMILEALLVSIVIYFVPYNGEILEGLVMGAIWLASAPHHAVGRQDGSGAASASMPLLQSNVIKEHCCPAINRIESAG